MNDGASNMKPADLRGILNYVPRFLGQTFIISLDGAILNNPNLPNILLDVAVLKSLQINIVIVHGIGKQLVELSQSSGIEISNSDGTGPTDPATLDLAIRASSRVSHQILEALTQTGLKCAITNSVRSKPIGVINGVDHQRSGKVDRVDARFLKHLIEQNIVPIIQPIGFDRNGHTLRINSDSLATEIAVALEATKTIFVAELPGLKVDGELKRQLPVEELEAKLQSSETPGIEEAARSKALHACLGVKKGVSRIHILDGSLHDGLIREVFSNEGVGTLVYGNEYQQIRQAKRSDIPLLFHLTSGSIAKGELATRSIEFIEQEIDHFHVYEIDGNLIGCVLISRFSEAPETAEINSLVVHPLYQKQGIGLKLVNFACHKAQSEGRKRILALSTQSYSFFQSVCGFRETDASALPESRALSYSQQKRQSKVLIKDL